MTRFRALSALAALLIACAPATSAQSAEWLWRFHSYSDFQDSGTHGWFGSQSSAQDGYGPEDSLIASGAKVYYGTYHQGDSWPGPAGFYREDVRALLPEQAGLCSTWTFFVWADPTLDSTAYRMVISWYLLQPSFTPPPQFHYRIVLRSKPNGITGGPDVGTAWNLSVTPNRGVELPVYRSTDGLTGYKFDFIATYVPEPSSLLAIFTGIGAYAGFVRRRRR